MEKLNRAQKWSILEPQNLGSRGGPGPRAPPGSALGGYVGGVPCMHACAHAYDIIGFLQGFPYLGSPLHEIIMFIMHTK